MAWETFQFGKICRERERGRGRKGRGERGKEEGREECVCICLCVHVQTCVPAWLVTFKWSKEPAIVLFWILIDICIRIKECHFSTPISIFLSQWNMEVKSADTELGRSRLKFKFGHLMVCNLRQNLWLLWTLVFSPVEWREVGDGNTYLRVL